MTNYRLTSRLLDLDAVQELMAFKYDLVCDVYTAYEQDLPVDEDPVALSLGPVTTASLVVLTTDTAITVSINDADAPFTVEDVLILTGTDVASALDVIAVDGAHIHVFLAGA